MALLLGLWAGSGYAAADPQATKAQLATLKQSIGQLQQQLKRDQQAYTQAGKALLQADQHINQLGQQLFALDQQLAALKTDLGGYQAQKQQLEAQLAAQQQQLAALLRRQYRLGQQSRLLLLLSQRDPEQIDRMLRYHQHFSQAQTTQLHQFKTLLLQLRQTHVAIDSTQAQIMAQRDAIDQQLETLQAAREQRKVAHTQLQQQIRQDKQQLSRLNADRERLQQVLKQVEASLSLANLSRNRQAFRRLKGKLPTPVDGKILRRYGSVQANIRYDGLLLAGAAGTPVAAVHHGRVVFADWLRGYGLLTILDHGDGYLSLYGHNETLLKETGDWVSQGEQIATLGNSGGDTAPGLYFAIRHHGKAVNPSIWLRKR